MKGIINNRFSILQEENGTESNQSMQELSGYDKNIVIFWVETAFCLCVALFAVIGNGLVLFASHGNKNCGPLRYLDNEIKSLAIADMFFGLIGTPMIIFSYYLCKF